MTTSVYILRIDGTFDTSAAGWCAAVINEYELANGLGHRYNVRNAPEASHRHVAVFKAALTLPSERRTWSGNHTIVTRWATLEAALSMRQYDLPGSFNWQGMLGWLVGDLDGRACLDTPYDHDRRMVLWMRVDDYERWAAEDAAGLV